MRLSARNGRVRERKTSIDTTRAIPIWNTRMGEPGGGIRRTQARFIPPLVLIITFMFTFSAQAQQQTPYTPARAPEVTVGRTGTERAAPSGVETGAVSRRAESRRAASARRAARGSGPAPPSVTGEKGGFEAIKAHPVKYPEISDKGKKIVKLEAVGMSISQFLQRLSLATGWSILPTPEVTGRITGWLSNISVSDALKLLEISGFYYEQEGNILYVMSQDEYYSREYGALVKEEFSVKHANLTDVNTVLKSFQSKDGKIVADPRTGKLIVIDTKDNIEYMKEVLKSLDVKVESISFQPKYALADDLLQHIEPILSERGEVQTDVRTNMLTITDVPERIERVRRRVAELDVELAKETFQINFARPSEVRGMLEQILPAETSLIAVDERTRQLAVRAVPETLKEARQIVEDFDKKLKQVAIEAYIMTVNTQRVRELGINWAYFDDPEELLAAGLLPDNLDFAVGGVLVGRTRISSDHLRAVVNLLATDNDAEILANPRVLVSDGETAQFENVTREPYQEGGYAAGLTTGVSTHVVPMTVKFVAVGTTLQVTPMVNYEGFVEMQISAKDSSAELREIQSGTGFSTTVPVETMNSITTKVLVRSGETIVIGGLRVDSATRDVDKVPFFGDIPVLGHFFKSTTRRTGDRQLLIFIRPEIVEEADTAEGRLAAEFQQGLVEQVLESDMEPFDLGGKQKPFIRRRGFRKGRGVPPFVPRYRRDADVVGNEDAGNGD